MINWQKDYSITDHPEWIGIRHKISQMIEATQQDPESGQTMECFI